MNETLETALILGIVPVSLFGFVPTWLKHRNFRLGAIFLIGLTLIMASQFAVGHHHDLSVAQIVSQSETYDGFHRENAQHDSRRVDACLRHL